MECQEKKGVGPQNCHEGVTMRIWMQQAQPGARLSQQVTGHIARKQARKQARPVQLDQNSLVSAQLQYQKLIYKYTRSPCNYCRARTVIGNPHAFTWCLQQQHFTIEALTVGKQNNGKSLYCFSVYGIPCPNQQRVNSLTGLARET